MSLNIDRIRPESKRLIFLVALVALSLWTLPLFFTPTFDLDEALYRLSAQEMKASCDYFHLLWSGEPYYDKPPLHVWTIVLASKLIDKGAGVSSVAAKLPSFLATLFTVLLAGFYWKKLSHIIPTKLKKWGFQISNHRNISGFLIPACFMGFALLPITGGSSAIIDPLLLFALTPFFLSIVLNYYKHDGVTGFLSVKTKVIMSLSISFACALKGPIGLILPVWTFFIHEFISASFQKDFSFLNYIKKRIQQSSDIIQVFFSSFFMVLLFYFFLYIYAGKTFISEFFLVQNMQRGLRPFEGHSGPFFYHFAVVAIGGSILIPFIISGLRAVFQNKKLQEFYPMWGYPLSWSLGIILFYSCIATKLPNYTWPVWIGLCTISCFIWAWSRLGILKISTDLSWDKIFYFIPFLLGLFISIAPLFIENFFSWLTIDHRAKIVVDSILPLPIQVKFSLIFSGLILMLSTIFLYFKQKSGLTKLNISSFALSQSLFATCLCLGVMPFIEDKIYLPAERLTEFAMEQLKKSPKEEFVTIGLNSPTVSRVAFNHVVHQFPKDDTSSLKSHVALVLVPKWIEPSCYSEGYSVIKRDGYLSLCSYNPSKKD